MQAPILIIAACMYVWKTFPYAWQILKLLAQRSSFLLILQYKTIS